MAGFLNGSGFEGAAPPQQAVEQAPNPVMAGVGQLFDLLASDKKRSGSSADQRAEMAIASRGTFLERLDEIKQLQLQGQNVKGLVREAYKGAILGGMKQSEIGGMAADFGIDLGEINSTVGEGSPHDYSNQEPPAEEFAAFYGAAKMQNPDMGDDELYATAKNHWVNNQLYEDEAQWKTLSSNQAWEASKDFVYGNANTAFWEIMGGDLNETGTDGEPDNQIGLNTLQQMKTLIADAKNTMKSRWNARNEEEGGSSRDDDINDLFWQFDAAINIAEEGMLLAPDGTGKAGPNYQVATWVMAQSGSDIAAVINRYAKANGESGNVVSADGREFDAGVKTEIANWMKAFTLGTGKEGNLSDRARIEDELAGDTSISSLLGDGKTVPATLKYIYNAVIEEGTPEYLKSKREEISALAEVMGWSLESLNGVDPAAATGEGATAATGEGATGEGTNGTVGKVADVHPLVLFAQKLDDGKIPGMRQKAEEVAIKELTNFYDGGKILGGVTKEIGGKVPQIVAWQGYESATPKVQKAMEAQVDAAGQHLARVLKTVINMNINGMDGNLQEKVMGSERMVNIIRAMNSSGVPGARKTAVALAHIQGQAANKVVALNGKYFESIAKTIEGSSYSKIIKPLNVGGPVEINLEAFTNSSLLESFEVNWDYELNDETPGNLRTLLSEIRDNPPIDRFGVAANNLKGMTDHELIKILAAEGLTTGVSGGNLRLISPGKDGYEWNTLNNVVKGIGLEDDTLAGLTANQYAAVMTGIKGISTQLQKYEKANAGRQSAFNAMEGAKALWTELTGQGFTEDGAPMVSLEEAAAGVRKTPDAAAAETAAEAPEEPVKEEDFGTFLQQFARERGYSEEEIAKTVADINAAGGSAAYIKAQKKENPAYFHEDVAAAIAAKPDGLWIKGEDGKLVQNPDADVEEVRNSWELGVLDALRKIDPAFTLADAKEAAAVATAVEASEAPQRTPDELKVALEKGEIDQATFDAKMAEINGSETPQRTPDQLKVALEKGEIDQATFDAEMAKMSGSEVDVESAVGETPDDKITTTVLPDEATENLIEGANKAIDASEVALKNPEESGSDLESQVDEETATLPPGKEGAVPRGQVSDPDGNVHRPHNNHEAIVSSLITTEAVGGSPTAWHSRNNEAAAAGTVGGVYLDRGHFGRLQFGPARLQEAQEAGVMPADMTVEGFLKSPETQVAVERWHIADHTKNIMGSGLHNMVGKRIGGVTITLNGMIAAAHLGGFNGMKKFIQGGANPKDAYGTSLMKYLRVHGGAKAPVIQVQHKTEVMERFLGMDHNQLDVNLSNNLTSLLRDAEAAGHNVGLNSGYRSPERQAQILANNMTRRERGGFTNGERDQWMADVKEHGPVGALSVSRNGRSWRQRFSNTPNGNSIRRWIGLPGGSKHQHGLAGDLNFNDSDAAEKWIHDNAEKYGLHFPMGHEPWHIQLIGGAAAASGYSAATAEDAQMIQDLARDEGISYDEAMDKLVADGVLSEEEDYVPQALADDFGDPGSDTESEDLPFMLRDSGGRNKDPDAELYDKAWRKLEEDEIEELIEVSEGDSGLRSQAAMSLGNRYQNGRGVPEDKDKARQFYESVVIDGGELAEEAATALESIDNLTPSEATQLMREEGRGTMIKGEPYILLPGGAVVRGRDGEVANEAITALVKKRLRVDDQPQ